MSQKFVPPGLCPVCGDDVPRGAKACPECGADDRSGWRADASLGDGLDLPDDDFNYEEFVAEEFGEGKASARTPIWWIIAAAVLLLAFALAYVM